MAENKTVNRATAALPQTATDDLFSISGTVELLAIVGKVTTVIQTQANATKLTYTDTATSTATDLCATLDITADAVGTIYTITGTFANAMQDGPGVDEMQATSLILTDGVIALDCGASNTGSVAWYVIYRPVSDGAYIGVAA